MAGEAQLAAGAVLDQKILADQVFGLHVRIVARRALHVSIDQLHRSSRVGGLTVRRQRSDQIDSIFQRQPQAEGVRRLHVAAEDVGRIHRSAGGHLPIGHRGSNCHGTVMATQALIAVGAERRLSAVVRFGVAGVGRVVLRGELLVPEADLQP